jgi:hypothetical protein
MQAGVLPKLKGEVEGWMENKFIVSCPEAGYTQEKTCTPPIKTKDCTQKP